MQTTEQMKIFLPQEVANAVKAKVDSGEYENASEVVLNGLSALFSQDKALDFWLENSALPAYDALQENPARAQTPEDVRAALAALHQETTKKQSKAQQ